MEPIARRFWLVRWVSFAVLGLAVLFAINIRPHFPNVRRTSTLLVSIAVLIVLLAPYVWRFFAVDGCLDSGGAWERGKRQGKELAGKAVGNKRLQREGKVENLGGKAGAAYGDLKKEV